ncbi:hypothetical protein [Brevundimonas halotolerans]|uniref:Lipoprotein n=1 Tax=Brevundimonas halotolerans TaxID=69670 RepID=A0A7W9A159_9CAUL|nr:hypothetical protein [Brevundimonas halotolerans]MBB5659516.1 hypothetical protein [Brevundimonas halotolerans]
MLKRLVPVLAVLVLGGCASDMEADDPFADMFGGVPEDRAARVAVEAAAHPLGTEQNPVRVNMPAGQRAYLSRLRCADGKAPTFERLGSAGDGPYGTIMDGYQVDCPGSQPATNVIYLDMYHPSHVETKAPPGYTIVP